MRPESPGVARLISNQVPSRSTRDKHCRNRKHRARVLGQALSTVRSRGSIVRSMAVADLGRWEPLSVTATIDTFRGAPFRWWLSGGHALELYLGRSWRDHDDTDVGIARQDAPALRPALAQWDIHIAAGGHLEPWTGDELHAARHQNNLWCRRDKDGPWLLDVTIGEGDDEVWIYRRDPSIRFPWTDAVLQSPESIPYTWHRSYSCCSRARTAGRRTTSTRGR